MRAIRRGKGRGKGERKGEGEGEGREFESLESHPGSYNSSNGNF